jgi:hypothetical protein
VGREEVVAHVWVKSEMGTKFWSLNQNGRDRLEDLSIDSRMIIKWMLNK